jgi:hypothetical protein
MSAAAAALKIVDRAIDICVKPRATFLEIEREKAGFTALYRDYVLWLAALPAFVKLLVALLGRHYGRGLAPTLAGAFLDYVCLLAGVYVLALVINSLAPYFGGERDEDQALRLCAYALTPSFLASAAGAIPGLAWCPIFGLYSIALIAFGLPRLMRNEDGQTLAYSASAAVAMAAIALVINLLTTWLLP